MNSTKEQVRLSLIRSIVGMGYPEEFGILIAESLGTEKQMNRMLSYLIQFRPHTAEEIADEMLAIQADFEKYRSKIISEYYNQKNNELLNSGPLDDD